MILRAAKQPPKLGDRPFPWPNRGCRRSPVNYPAIQLDLVISSRSLSLRLAPRNSDINHRRIHLWRLPDADPFVVVLVVVAVSENPEATTNSPILLPSVRLRGRVKKLDRIYHVRNQIGRASCRERVSFVV